MRVDPCGTYTKIRYDGIRRLIWKTPFHFFIFIFN